MRRFQWFVLAGIIPIPWFLLRLSGIHLEPYIIALTTGAAITSSAFMLSWSSEAAEKDFSGPIIIVALALIAVLPEYAVDGTLAWQAGKDESFAPYAIANMTGANRILVGVGWPLIVFFFFLKTRSKEIELPTQQRLDCGILTLATLYVFTIPIKGYIAWYDALLLCLLFSFYLFKVIKISVHSKTETIGPARAITRIENKKRRITVWVCLMVYAAVAIFISAEPFAHGLIESGKILNIDEFLLVQWLAPLASEAPEFIIAIIFASRLFANKGLGILISSEVNQLTLLIASIPVLFMLSSGSFLSFPLDSRQSHEIWLTAAQSLFAVTLLVNLRLSLKESLFIFTMFCLQFVIPLTKWANFRDYFIILYLVFAGIKIIQSPGASWSRWKSVAKATFSTSARR